MKKKQLKEYIKEIIISELATKVTSRTGNTMLSAFKDMNDANRFKQENPNIAKIQQFEENTLNEMAGYYKVKDKAGFKKALKTYKELKGDKFDKNALGRLLTTLDKEGEVEIKSFAKELKKDPATYNNEKTRSALEKPGGEFTDYILSLKSKEKSEKEAPKKVAPKKEEPKKEEPKKKESPKKEEPKKKEAPKKVAPKKEEPKKKEKVEDDDFSDEKEPSMSDLKNIEKTLRFDDFDDDDDF